MVSCGWVWGKMMQYQCNLGCFSTVLSSALALSQLSTFPLKASFWRSNIRTHEGHHARCAFSILAGLPGFPHQKDAVSLPHLHCSSLLLRGLPLQEKLSFLACFEKRKILEEWAAPWDWMYQPVTLIHTTQNSPKLQLSLFLLGILVLMNKSIIQIFTVFVWYFQCQVHNWENKVE